MGGVFLFNQYRFEDLQMEWSFIALILVVALLIAIHHLVSVKSTVYGIILTLFLISYGYLHAFNHDKLCCAEPEFGKCHIACKVLKKRDIDKNRSIVTIRSIPTNSNHKAFRASLFLSQAPENITPGSVMLCKAVLNPLSNEGNPGEFDFASWLKRQHISANGYITDFHIIEQRMTYSWYIWQLKEKLKILYHKAGIKAENAALIFALTSGDKSLIKKDQRQAFADSGVVHILAVSGLHVGMLYLMIFALLKPLNRWKNGKVISFVIVSLLLLIYALFTGLSPSVTRAVVMFIFIDLGRLLKKSHLIYNIILISAFVIALIDPHYLFEPGFWLSYGAVLSILLIMGLVTPLIRNKPGIVKRFYEIILVTMAAQPGTFPLVLYWFRQFPKYFLLTNIFIIPFIGIALIYNFIIIILGAIGVPLKLIAKPLDWLLTYINYIPDTVSGFKNAVWTAININMTSVAVMYLILGLILALFYRQNLKLMKPVALMAILLISFSSFTEYQTQKRREVVVFNAPSVIIAERNGKACTFYNSNMEKPDQCIADYVNNAGIRNVSTQPANKLIYAGGEIFHLVSDGNDPMLVLPVKRYLLLDAFPEDLSKSLPYIKQCIILRSANYYDREKVINWCKENRVPYFNIKEEGAFVINLK